MKTNYNKKHMFVFVLSVVLAILLCMFRLQLFCGFIEPDTGFYVVGTNLGTYFNIALVIVIVAIMVGVVFSKTCVSGPLLSDSTAVVFSASLCGFLFATVLVLGAVEFFANKMQSAFFILEMLLCIPSVVGFFNICAKEKLERSTKNMIFALSPAVFYAVRTIHVFTDTTTQINTSQRSLTLVMLCSMMLLFVYEAYFLIPKSSDDGEKQKKSISYKYSVLTLVVMTLSITCTLPYIAVSAFWVYESEMLVMDVLDFCVGIYAGTRAIAMCKQ